MLPYLFLVIGISILIVDLSLTGGLVLPIGVSIVLTGITAFVTTKPIYLSMAFALYSVVLYGMFVLYDRKIKSTSLGNNKTGIVQDCIGGNRYLVMFPTGFKGETVWNAFSEEELKAGDKVRVADIDGNILIVEKVKMR